MKDEFGELGERHGKAHKVFLEMDAREHREPDKPSRFRNLPWIMIPFFIVAVAGIVLSASRTGFVFYDIARAQFGSDGLFPITEAITEVIVVDLFVVLARYVVILIHYQRTHESKEITAWIWRGFWTAFGVAIAANVYSSVKLLPIIQGIRPVLDLIMGLSVGISVPLLAFISGDILGILWVNALDAREKSTLVYQEALRLFNEARERRFNSRKKDFGLVIKAQIEPVNAVNPVHLTTRNKIERTSKQLDRALEWLENNPGHLKTPSRELVERVGVSHVTIYKAQQIMLGDGYANGRVQ